MKTIGNLAKKAIKWYFDQYAQCFNERYYKYSYRLY